MVSEKLASAPTFGSLNAFAFALPPTHVIIQLVDTFFSQTGMLFPYIAKKSITDEIVNLDPLGRFNGIRRSWLCLLNTIMAFATVLTSDDEQKQDNVAKADTFFQRALKLLPNVTLQPANIEICKDVQFIADVISVY